MKRAGMKRPGMKRLSGVAHDYSGAELLAYLKSLSFTGTVFLENERGYTFLSLADGDLKPEHSSLFQPYLNESGLKFLLHSHEKANQPQVSSLFTQSFVPVLRALPDLGHADIFANTLSDLLSLFKQLASTRFSGALWFSRPVERGLVLCQDGAPRVAYMENDGKVHEHADALRLMRKLARSVHTQIYYRQLDDATLGSLMGLSESRPTRREAGETGVESTENGYHFYVAGTCVFQVAAELSGRSGFYAQQTQLVALNLPSEPLGWESQTYRLTLRGRDTLNPITELAMQAGERYGKMGKHILEHLSTLGTHDKAPTAETLSNDLRLELSELREQLSVLEEDGLVKVSST